MNTEVEFAKLWEPGISGIELFSVRLFHHAFSKHMHEALESTMEGKVALPIKEKPVVPIQVVSICSIQVKSIQDLRNCHTVA